MILNVIYSHVAGEMLRLITSESKLKGASIHEKEKYMQQHSDFIRTGATIEPHRHSAINERHFSSSKSGITFLDGNVLSCKY